MFFKKLLSCSKCLLIAAGIITSSGLVFLYSGVYPMGADVHHNKFTYWVLETLRERSIARSASGIEVPKDLGSSSRLLKGGADYNDMCISCHLKPGKAQSDFTLGLYPAPPNLSLKGGGHDHGEHDKGQYAQQRQFWIIKHGIKASGMPAWAPGHDDERIWNMVSFINRMPDLSPAQYQILTVRNEGSEGHGH